ncbi:MAG: P-type conjugative transfer ATPase TrbB [Rhizobiales bacterium]|nr:P-type conjugative transfer ATPase TrbB [Hyphomicrobiales bacterium]
MNPITEHRLAEAFSDRLGGFIRDALDDPEIIEIMVNADGTVWLDRLTDGRSDTGQTLLPAATEAIIRLVAHHIGETVSEAHPLVAGILPVTGERFQGVLPPIAKGPCFTIRKRPAVVFRLDDYVAGDAMTAEQAEILRNALLNRQNILVSGGTSSGKTTLLNALLAEPSIVDDRIVLIEDTVELQCAAHDQLQLLTKRTPPAITIRDLVQTTLRLRPDRIVIGEIREGAGALDMLKAWNTGHSGGLGTLHANSGGDALHRLEDLISEVAVNVPHRLIGQAVDLIVHIDRTPSGRCVQEILAVHGYQDGRYVTAEAEVPLPKVSVLVSINKESSP